MHRKLSLCFNKLNHKANQKKQNNNDPRPGNYFHKKNLSI